MTAVAPSAPVLSPPRGGLVSTRKIADGFLGAIVFIGGFVLFEPAPYELLLVVAIPLYFLAGLQLRASFGPLVVCLLVYMVGGMLAVTQVRAHFVFDGVIYMAVSLFLCLSAIWFAAMVAEDWTRIRIVERAYVAAAVLSAAIGILAYFRLLPGSDLFLLYGRARGTFQDPNVLGPYLILPILLLARRLMTAPLLPQGLAIAAFTILVLGVLLSFSRAAWGMLAAGLPLMAFIVAANATSNRQRLRLLAIVAVGCVALVLLVMVAASIPAVADLLAQRAKLVQEYDGKTGAELGRFARHAVGFLMAAERPLGIGPNEFPALFIEATHNNYLKALMEYGWLGFLALVVLVVATLRAGFLQMFRPRPWQGFAQALYVTFVLHLMVGWIIDTDHWRHFYMMFGLIWGLVTVEAMWRRAGRRALRP